MGRLADILFGLTAKAVDFGIPYIQKVLSIKIENENLKAEVETLKKENFALKSELKSLQTKLFITAIAAVVFLTAFFLIVLK